MLRQGLSADFVGQMNWLGLGFQGRRVWLKSVSVR